MQKLLVLQSLWTFESLRHPLPQATSLSAQLALVAASGFDGIGTLWLDRRSAAQAARPAKALGLAVEGLALPRSVDDLKPALEWGVEFGLHHLNIQPDIRPGTTAECLAVLEGWQRLAEQVDFPIFIETHRGRMTNDLLFTLALLDACPDIRLTADLSHYVVGNEVVLPPSPEMEARFRQIMDRAHAYHGRVASAEQVQLDIGFASSARWVEQFRQWWAYGFAGWRERAPADAELTFLCELGAAPYAVSGPDGRDIGDRWADSLTLMAMARAIWAESVPIGDAPASNQRVRSAPF